MLNKPSLDIGRAELQLIADGWQSAASASLAIRILRPCLKWAEKRELVREGVANLEQPGRAKKRERIVTTDEIEGGLASLKGIAWGLAQMAPVDGLPIERSGRIESRRDQR